MYQMAMVGKIFLVGVMLQAIVPSAPAQESPEFQACIDHADGVSTAMLDCGHAEIAKWDIRLNAAYRALMNSGNPADQAHLRLEQRAWLKHHLSETHRLAADPDAGSGAFLVSQDFELDDLKARTLVLEKRVQDR
jgi:uncharacterized protein YecT (DUF1311 family)